MQTCRNDLSLNLYVVPPISHMVAISKNGFVRSYKKRSKTHYYFLSIDTGDLVSTLVNDQASYYKVIISLKYIK